MSVLNDLGEFLRSGIRRYNVPGASIAVLRNGRLAAAEAAGVINLDTRVQTDTDSVFQIGSITKILPPPSFYSCRMRVYSTSMPQSSITYRSFELPIPSFAVN